MDRTLRAWLVRLFLALRTNREVPVRRVLLLNVTYEPLTTVGLRRAVCLVLGEKAEIVDRDNGGRMLHPGPRGSSPPVRHQAPQVHSHPAAQPGPADQGGADAPRQLPVRLLRPPRR